MSRQRVVVLLSGGVDSAACVHYYKKLRMDARGLFVDYGQPVVQQELMSAKKVSSFYGLELEAVRLRPARVPQSAEILGRNALLVVIALTRYQEQVGIISLGIHRGVDYYDTKPSFFRQMRRLVQEYTRGKGTVDCPFLRWSKGTIYRYCKEHGVPVHLTYSCEFGPAKACKRCASCLDRQRFDAC